MAYYDRARALLSKREYDKAISDFTEAIRLEPTDGKSYYFRGYAYEEKGQNAKAEEDLAEAKKLGYKSAGGR